MKPRIKLTRIHQINGPDYWQADCYIADHTLQSVGTTVQKALNAMYPRIDGAIHSDWILAHWMNQFYDEEKERNKVDIFAEISKTTKQIKERHESDKKWKWYNWFWNPEDSKHE